MSALLTLLNLRAGSDAESWIGPASGPPEKRAYGGQFVAQSLAAACRTVDTDRLPTNMHLQFLRGGEAGAAVEYRVTRVFDGRTSSARRIESRQQGRLLTTATVSFALPARGPEHGHGAAAPHDPDSLPKTGPAGPAPSMPLEELDIRIADDRSTGEFVRRLWWRATVPLPDDPLMHTLIAVYVCDVYMIDPALQVHGHSMQARTHRSGTTDSAIWFHQPVFADQWNLLESTSPAAARGRGVVTASLIRADGVVAATLAQEGLIAEREP
ncbi:acyl-CoA thioesterase II [Mycolicibacterium celeriflavum]|uniref:Acyl-CoA thioesterase II n=1 Tax=Mycolicibacterium celeriflavum TaxID=1249101 RepID=A0A1X0C2C5_MYCCF|nr:acyl-CoA thioesterase domain-containing protein [Mycolicibacterium celeriflavum]MCV7239571.1 thioesterase family protein [Mycolicibacterium celeriflavum]OBG13299.1 acyl-CoA thioesterase II [Mycolicibacterium celeriflavum]ORA51603.1 acyl-CoA thioesterase II [Mycolicibacterium celeriflavum]BBY43263.1 acyl-CoA thioesterase II [Mycolicibacterium celeriflavum]